MRRVEGGVLPIEAPYTASPHAAYPDGIGIQCEHLATYPTTSIPFILLFLIFFIYLSSILLLSLFLPILLTIFLYLFFFISLYPFPLLLSTPLYLVLLAPYLSPTSPLLIAY